MSEKEASEGRLSRPVIFAVAGLVVIAIAIGMSVWSRRHEEPSAPTSASVTPPAASSTTGTTGESNEKMAAAQPEKGKASVPAAVADAPPSFDVVRVAPGGQTVIAGRAAPNAEVAILDSGKQIGKVTADSSGEWVFTPDQPLRPGSRELSLEATNPGGAVKQGDAPVVLVVPERTGPATAGGSGANEVLAVKVEPGGTVQLLQVPTAGQSSGPVSIGVVNFDDKNHLSVAGRALPKASVEIYLDNGAVASAQADSKGAWSIGVVQPLSEGSHTIRADQVAPGGAGKVTARAEITFAVGDAQQRAGNVTVTLGTSLWRIARQAYGRGFAYINIYQANKDQIRDPNLIYPGQVFKLPSRS